MKERSGNKNVSGDHAPDTCRLCGSGLNGFPRATFNFIEHFGLEDEAIDAAEGWVDFCTSYEDALDEGAESAWERKLAEDPELWEGLECLCSYCIDRFNVWYMHRTLREPGVVKNTHLQEFLVKELRTILFRVKAGKPSMLCEAVAATSGHRCSFFAHAKFDGRMACKAHHRMATGGSHVTWLGQGNPENSLDALVAAVAAFDSSFHGKLLARLVRE